MKCRVLSLVLMCFIVLQCVPCASMVSAATTSKTTEINNQSFAKIEKCNETKISNIMNQKDAKRVKYANDFVGNLYYIVEYFNSGYLIGHADSGSIIEYSESAPSPYQDYDTQLYYCGPMGYYYLKDNQFIHTITKESFSCDEMEVVNTAIILSKELHHNCMINAESGEDGIKADQNQKQSNLKASKVTKYFISNYSLIKNLVGASDVGYYTHETATGSEGCCGYVAAGVLLFWYDRTKNGNAINDFIYLNSSKSAFRNGDFTRYLRSLGKYSSSDATGILPGDESIEDVLTSYGTKRSLGISVQTSLLPTRSEICNWLKTYNAPIIVFGKLPRKPEGSSEKIYHAVVAYGWTDDAIIVHYGWAGYSEIMVVPSFLSIGSILCIDKVTTKNPTIIDIPLSDWAYTAANYCKRYGIIDNKKSVFDRNNYITRAEFVNALYQLAGAPIVSDDGLLEKVFTDFYKSTSYREAIIWAFREGILNGTTSTTIEPNSSLTREQAATFLHRFSVAFRYNFLLTGGPQATSFPDYSGISGYAKLSMNWATTRYLIQGTDGALQPKANLRRDHAAQLVYNFTKRASH